MMLCGNVEERRRRIRRRRERENLKELEPNFAGAINTNTMKVKQMFVSFGKGRSDKNELTRDSIFSLAVH